MSEIKMIFDTNCVLCSGFVHFILKHERNQNIVFVNAWSKTGAELAALHDLAPDDLQHTYLVIKEGEGFIRSQASMEILRQLKWPWRWLRIARIIPLCIRDWLYAIVANHRYQWFGYEERCFVPTPQNSHRFIDV